LKGREGKHKAKIKKQKAKRKKQMQNAKSGPAKCKVWARYAKCTMQKAHMQNA